MTSQERRGDGLKSPATCPFVHKLLKAINKNDIKGPHYLIFENDVFPSQNATNADGVPMLCSRNTCWRHQMETFSALLALCAKNSPVTDEFPSQGPVTRSFGVFFDPLLNKRLSKQSWGWWCETPSRSLSRQCNESCNLITDTFALCFLWSYGY